MADLDLDTLVFSAPSFPWWFGISICALGSNPWSEELRRVEMGLKVPYDLSRGNGRRLVDCENALDNFAWFFGHYGFEEGGGTVHGHQVEAHSNEFFSPCEPLKERTRGGM